MLIDAFIPESIGSYYLRKKRIIGIDITKTAVYSCFVVLAGRAITIERVSQEWINIDETRDYEGAVLEAVKKILNTIKPDLIVTNIHLSSVIFKEMTLPFINYDKISQIIEFEAANVLPIDTNTTAIDFIITHTELSGQSSLMLAAAKKEALVLQKSFEAFAPNALHKITNSIFELYGLLIDTHEYTQEPVNALVLIQCDTISTTVSYIKNKQLKFVRTFPKGIFYVARQVAQEQSINTGEVIDELMRFGFQKDNGQKILENFDIIMDEIQFTLNSFYDKNTESPIEKIIYVGACTDIPGFIQYAEKKMGIPSSHFDPKKLITHNKSIKLASGAHITPSHIIALSFAIPNSITQQFSFDHETIKKRRNAIFGIQLGFGIAIILAIFLSIITMHLLTVRALNRKILDNEKTVVKHLNNLQLSQSKSLKTALSQAEETVTKEEALWFAFSRDRRFSFLELLQTLHTSIDKKRTGLTLKKLTVTPTYITIEGKVSDFESLKQLERSLKQTQLFIQVPPLQELSFNEKLLLKKLEPVHD